MDNEYFLFFTLCRALAYPRCLFFNGLKALLAGAKKSTRQDVAFILHRDGFMLLVMDYTGKKAMQIKIACIMAFNALEAQLAATVKTLPQTLTPSTTASRKPLEKLVKVWAAQGGLIAVQCWTMLNAAFNLQSITELPEEWIPDAIAWVQGKIDALPQTLTPSTAEDRAPLRTLVHAWAKITSVHHAALWPQVKAHFQLSRIDDLPVEWLPDALAFVQGKIDGPQRAAELSQAVAPVALVPTVADLATIPAEASDLPNLKRLLKDIRRAAECLAPCENWTHIAVRGELEHAATKGSAWAVSMNINAAWYALGLARSSLLAAVEVGRMGR